MEPAAKKTVLSFFNYHLKKYGDRPEALRWTPEGQLRRYHTFLDIAPDLNNQKILDYGCGLADFYQFLKRRGITVRYTGMDINENFITRAKQKYPECTFTVIDIDEEPLTEYYDYIFVCGVFNLKVPGVHNDLKNALAKLFAHCNKGLALSALSTHAPEKAPELSYTSPEELVKFAIENLSPSVVLRHDRIPSDFTLFVYTSFNEIRL